MYLATILVLSKQLLSNMLLFGHICNNYTTPMRFASDLVETVLLLQAGLYGRIFTQVQLNRYTTQQ